MFFHQAVMNQWLHICPTDRPMLHRWGRCWATLPGLLDERVTLDADGNDGVVLVKEDGRLAAADDDDDDDAEEEEEERSWTGTVWIVSEIMKRMILVKATWDDMSRDDYIKEGIRQLSDANFYVKLDYDPTPNHIDEIHNTLLKALQRDEITKKIFEFLVPTDCTTPAWYFLPKIHM